jgi:Uma2 family endonuclease
MPEGHLVTAEELERMGERGHLFELVRGELVPVNPPGGEHGALAVAIAAELWAFVRERGLGRVYTESGFVLSRGPDTVRGPDVSFVSREREATAGLRRGFLQAAPDLAVEIWSPDNSMPGLTRKALEYLAAGTRRVWLIDPRRRVVEVRLPDQTVTTLSTGDTIPGGEVLPGFALPLARLFAVLD